VISNRIAAPVSREEEKKRGGDRPPCLTGMMYGMFMMYVYFGNFLQILNLNCGDCGPVLSLLCAKKGRRGNGAVRVEEPCKFQIFQPTALASISGCQCQLGPIIDIRLLNARRSVTLPCRLRATLLQLYACKQAANVSSARSSACRMHADL
jgi:hypothetical protein